MTHSINQLKTTSSGLILMMSTLLCSCSVLTPTKVTTTNRYSFDNAVTVAKTSQKMAAGIATKTIGPTIVVSVPHAAAGFDSQHIVYVRQAHKLEYFQQSEWIEAPSVMLTPLVSSALERSGRFNSVVQSDRSRFIPKDFYRRRQRSSSARPVGGTGCERLKSTAYSGDCNRLT